MKASDLGGVDEGLGLVRHETAEPNSKSIREKVSEEVERGIVVVGGLTAALMRDRYSIGSAKTPTERQESATHVADAQIALINQHLDHVTDLERDLIAFGRAWASATTGFAEHFALVRQINAEIGHIPQATLDSWQETGPLRVRRELARRLQHLADKGLLDIDDADQTASHLVLLSGAEVTNRSYYSAVPPTENDITQIATAGVQTFLHGHLARPAGR